MNRTWKSLQTLVAKEDLISHSDLEVQGQGEEDSIKPRKLNHSKRAGRRRHKA